METFAIMLEWGLALPLLTAGGPATLLIPLLQIVLLAFFLWSLWKARRSRFALLSSEERFRFLFDHASDPVLLVDPGSGGVVEVNPSFLFWSGRRREEVLGRSLAQLTDQEPEQTENDLRTIQERGMAVLDRREFLRHNGERTALQVTGLRVEAKRGAGVLLFLRDLTEQEQAAAVRAAGAEALARSHAELTANHARLEAEIREREKMEASLRDAKAEAERATSAKSEFLAKMSHEIRTPMNGVIGMTELLMETDLTGEQREYAEAVHSSGELLLAIINDVLDFSKIEAGRLELERAPFDIRDQVAVAVKGLAVKAHQKMLELVFEVEPDVPETVIGDAVRFRQIVLNLVGNAIKFTAEGEVVVTVRRQDAPTTESVTLHVMVRDTGIGIAPDRQQAVFESFTQATADATRNYGGTGLGLSICRQLVERMGGRIWLESEPGKGSVFHFTVGMGCADPRTAAGQAVATPALAGKRALVVDDNRTNRFLLERWLGRWGMEVVSVPGGNEAISALEDAAAREQFFQIVLLDVQMPHMDGFQVIREIRKRPEWITTRILLLSSANAPGFASKAKGLGIAGFMLKPILPDELWRFMVRICSGTGTESLVKTDSASPPRPSLAPLVILLAEDNPVSQTLAQRMLEKRGHRVVTANDGKAAMAVWEAERVDVILMDGLMPVMDGFQATRCIRAAPPLPPGVAKGPRNPRVPIVAMTACALKGDREKCLEAGMDDYVAKPVRLEQLEAALARVVSANAGGPA